MKTTEELKLIGIDELIPYANNARTHSKDQINKLRSSLREFGFINPILIDKDYNILAGHGRVMAAREEGIKEVPFANVCIWAKQSRPTKSELHPTMKPVPLVAYPIQNSSMSNCIVLEPFAGSGSTLIACEQTGRICYAIELDEKYSDVIVKRYIEYVGSDEEVFLIRDGEKIPYKDTI
ncbi:DNA methyltransferase [Sporanaerobacter acetigenes]|uniref:Methyltransferase n=1 Tax=Sporanaerobacter acetigenes DSM 13106 TaxID=1123281 RepID=A0A1M5VF81_9FIRM|nr:DNA methyltransferase [Sporanaerobacter acetigenes]SHH73890.1 ParB-like nuclease domain-containing protein [Sporanaerobacter acetigenes DSM 13106]